MVATPLSKLMGFPTVCGIFGLILGDEHRFDGSAIVSAIRTLFQISETRGREAAGLAVATADRIDVIRTPESASAFLRSPDFGRFVAERLAPVKAGQAVAILGHARLVTNGFQALEANNQPTSVNGAVVVHNGIIVNDEALWLANPDLKRTAQVDTEVFAALLAKHRAEGISQKQALCRTFAAIEGETTVGALLADGSSVLAGTNTGSFYAAQNPDETAFVFLSEETMIRRVIEPTGAIEVFRGASLEHLPAGFGATIDVSRPILSKFSLGERPLETPAVEPALAAARRIESQADRFADLRAGMRRCTKCLMPETMPFIDFDEAGVCNYCRHYEPKQLKGRNALESELDAIRSSDGRPDCLVAFSGGRDSSYGLHLLRREFDMTPIAYTYDWGMVTDIARRNQARICGRLGVEHIWVSADIKAKHRNIRKNVDAWLRRPHLGMVPLFMAGDKQFFWYANKLVKEMGIPKIVFCMNDYERTDFKVGFAGVPPKNGGARHYHMSALYKAKLAGFYGGQYLLNPRYINQSIVDTLFAYVSYYFIEQNYLYLFDYIPWDEGALNNTLLDEYGWETASDTPTTWRIGDGTAAFYNYIYQTVAGFTENDAFRSNQVRAGVLSRNVARDLVDRENQVRWPSIREYLATIGIDLETAVRAIERIPKLYSGSRSRASSVGSDAQ